MNLSEATFRAAVAKLLMEELTAADKETRAYGLRLFLDAHQKMGLKSAEVRLPDGGHVANATLPQGKPKPEIDDAAFLALVEAERPDEIVKSVNPAYKKSVERHLKVVDGKVVDTRTGEVVSWAKVREPGPPKSFTITFTPEGRDAVKQAWRDDPAKVLEYLAPPALPALVVEEPAEAPAAADDDDMDLSALLEMRASQAGGEGQ